MKKRFFDKLRLLSRSSLQTRFLLRVLFPPFLILALISVTGYVVMSVAVQNSATSELQRVAATTAAKLEREFALRKTVLRSMGSQLFGIGADYEQKKVELSNNYKACASFVATNNRFTSAPGGVCKPFYGQFAQNSNLQKAVDDGKTEQLNILNESRQSNTNQLLTSYVEFFPETSLMFVVDKNNNPVSQTTSGSTILKSYGDSIRAIAKQALTKTVEGVYVSNGVSRQMVFAYPIDKGAVLASYDLDNAGFLYPSWKGAPIDSTRGYVVIADTKSNTGYPGIKDTSLYQPALKEDKTTLSSAGVDYLAVSEPVNGTTWRVVDRHQKPWRSKRSRMHRFWPWRSVDCFW